MFEDFFNLIGLDPDGTDDVFDSDDFGTDDTDPMVEYDAADGFEDMSASGQADDYQEFAEHLSPEQAFASTKYMEDQDGDGYAETFTTETLYDTNHDGYLDTIKITEEIDVDGDGLADYSSMHVEHMDDEGDINIYVAEDTNGNGTFETVTLAMNMDENGEFEDVFTYNPMENGIIDAYEPFDPASADMDSVVGDPIDAADSWHVQETGSSCAVASQEFVLEHFFDEDFSEEDLRDLAEENGWYSPEGGTPMNDVGNILEHFGLDVERSTGNTLEDLENCLANGGQVIVGIDADEMWEGGSDDFFGPGMGANHAIQVVGVDRTDPDHPMVIVNDSGVENGQCASVPAELFMDAWEDSDNFMVTAFEA